MSRYCQIFHMNFIPLINSFKASLECNALGGQDHAGKDSISASYDNPVESLNTREESLILSLNFMRR